MPSGYVANKISSASSSRSAKSSLASIARETLAKLRSQVPPTERPRLIDFILQVAPYFDRFDYFSPYLEALEGAIGGNLRLAFAAPPQHGKTEATLRAFLYWARYFPGKRHAYVTYNQTRSQEVAKFFQRIAEEAGFPVAGTLSIVELGNGTTIKFTSIEGGLTGYTVDGVCLIDDPIKGPEEARSVSTRRSCQEFWTAVARARRHEGTSFVIMATRWHMEDLTGYLVNQAHWHYINLKAIAEAKGEEDIDAEGRVMSDPLHRKSGESLWKRKPPEFFKEERADRYWWSAMYQGEPVPIGGSVFHRDPVYYRELPREGYRGVFGLDLAYTAKTHADWSICAELWAAPHPILGTAIYVVDVQRKQVDAPSFALTLRTKQSTRPWRMVWYAAGTEKGSADFLKKQGLPIHTKAPRGDKFVRAQPVAAAWNAGRVLVPDPQELDAPWLQPFLDCVQNFTGVGDSQDDDVDAIAAGFDDLMAGGRIKAGPSVSTIDFDQSSRQQRSSIERDHPLVHTSDFDRDPLGGGYDSGRLG